MSFGRQYPPYPMPARRKAAPIRGSAPMISVTPSTSAPASSDTRAIAFANEILEARNAFEASLESSAVRGSVRITRTPASSMGS